MRAFIIMHLKWGQWRRLMNFFKTSIHVFSTPVCPCLQNFRWFMAFAAHSFITWAAKKLHRNGGVHCAHPREIIRSSKKKTKRWELSRVHQKEYKFQCSCHRVGCRIFDKIYVRQKWIEYSSQSALDTQYRKMQALLANKLENGYSLNNLHKKCATSSSSPEYTCGKVFRAPRLRQKHHTHAHFIGWKQTKAI